MLSESSSSTMRMLCSDHNISIGITHLRIFKFKRANYSCFKVSSWKAKISVDKNDFFTIIFYYKCTCKLWCFYSFNFIRRLVVLVGIFYLILGALYAFSIFFSFRSGRRGNHFRYRGGPWSTGAGARIIDIHRIDRLPFVLLLFPFFDFQAFGSTSNTCWTTLWLLNIS